MRLIFNVVFSRDVNSGDGKPGGNKSGGPAMGGRIGTAGGGGGLVPGGGGGGPWITCAAAPATAAPVKIAPTGDGRGGPPAKIAEGKNNANTRIGPTKIARVFITPSLSVIT